MSRECARRGVVLTFHQLLFNNRLLLNLDVKSIVFKEKIGGFQFKQSQIMKVFILTLFATAFLSAYASPGGYILKGGVDHRYKHGKPAGYYDAASQAGKLDKILTHATHILSYKTCL